MAPTWGSGNIATTYISLYRGIPVMLIVYCIPFDYNDAHLERLGGTHKCHVECLKKGIAAGNKVGVVISTIAIIIQTL